MTIERTAKEIIVRLSPTLNDETVRQALKYLSYLEATQTSQATQEEVNNLVNEVRQARS